jgi:hypothetical protein
VSYYWEVKNKSIKKHTVKFNKTSVKYYYPYNGYGKKCIKHSVQFNYYRTEAVAKYTVVMPVWGGSDYLPIKVYLYAYGCLYSDGSTYFYYRGSV